MTHACHARVLAALAAMTLVTLAPRAATSRTLAVGPGLPLALPSQAAEAAHDGDRIEIAPGSYADCAVWPANRLTIVGRPPGVELAGRACEGKGIFVTRGDGITVEGITFRGARVPDRNGAGIRAEGRDLTVRRSRFLDNENGILGGAPGSSLHVVESEFTGNGVCAPVCAHGLYAGELALLRVERSVFRETRTGHHVKSRAARTELIGNTIEDGPRGTSSYLVDLPNGGSLLMRDNRLEKGPATSNRGSAVILGEEGVRHPGGEVHIENNRFANHTGGPTVFVRNLSDVPAELAGNVLEGLVIPLVGPGTVR